MGFRDRLAGPVLLAGLICAGLLASVACNGGRSSHAIPPTPLSPGSPAPHASASAKIKMLPGLRFDPSELTIPADTSVAVTVDNTAEGVSHNFAVYRSRAGADADANASLLARTDICVGPCKQLLDLTLSRGEYFFRCDVHPQQATGKLIVE